MIKDFSIFLSIISAELLSLFILYLFRCEMKGKYWFTLFFILAFLILFSTACIFYLNFNPIDEDTLKQSQATDLIYIFTAIATLLAPIVIIWSLDSWKESFNAEKYDKLLSERAMICSKIQQYILYDLSKRLYESKKNILEVINNYSYNMNVNEFYSKIDTSYNFIIQDLSILSDKLYINSLNILSFENKETIKIQSDIIQKVNSFITPYAEFKIKLWEHVDKKKLEEFIANFDELQAWKELENMNSRTDIISNISKLKTIKKAL